MSICEVSHLQGGLAFIGACGIESPVTDL